MPGQLEDKKEACKTYIEQTKLLVGLASAFVVAPPALFALVRSGSPGVLPQIGRPELTWMILSEAAFVLSVLLGYVVLATITGSQNNGAYDVYRPATRLWSSAQILSYVGGLVCFCILLIRALSVAQR